MGYIYRYGVDGPDAGGDYTISVDYPIEDDVDLGHAAEEAAKDYHDNHDGWEASWPATFSVFDEDGAHLGDVEVAREYYPEFEYHSAEYKPGGGSGA